MLNSPKSRAEKQFAAAQKQSKRVGKEKEKARHEQAEKMARLRSLRLAKETADKETGAAAKPKASSAAKHGGSELKAKGTTNEDVELDLLAIPSNLRRQTN
jgi:colicin import membrane protein